jgi:UDP-N-acetylglucosamine--N-acetylmuramyl-(pentapeptide) pyrophosphoryl-undecaprenol N-acetylglucosamine transferase
VLKELRSLDSSAELRFWCDKSFATQAKATLSSYDDSIRCDTIVAGKLRRYNHLSFLQQLTVPSLVTHNLRDLFFVAVGIVQSIAKMIIWRPQVVFTKGGYVCLPVGIAAAALRIPLVIHDSDAHPGLTNRILSRFATTIATGAPLKYYPYDKKKSHYVGIPIDSAFTPVNKEEQMSAKQAWGLDLATPLVVITGGGLGATRINDLIVRTLSEIQKTASVVLVSGTGQYDELRKKLPADDSRFQLHAYTTDMVTLLKAADVVVARAGATTLLELAALEKPTILIPNGRLTGGHQLKNAAVYQAADAVVTLDEDALDTQPELLVNAISSVLTDSKTTAGMAKRFGEFSLPNAAKDVANLIMKAAKK